jgi:hypothetical protein
MKALNTIPIENFLERARIARKSGQKTVNLSIDDADMLADSLATVMTRLAGELDAIALNSQQSAAITVQMDGGSL